MAAKQPASPSESTQDSQTSFKSTHLTDLETQRSDLESKLSSLTAQRNSLAHAILTSTQTSTSASTTNSHNATDSVHITAQAIEQDQTNQREIDSALRTARAIMKEHIALIQRYNEIKDIGQGLLGLIAEQRGCRIVDVMEELGVEDD